MIEEPVCLVQLSAQPHEPFGPFNLAANQSGLPLPPPLLAGLDARLQIGDFRLERRRKNGCLRNFTRSHRRLAPARFPTQLGSMPDTVGCLPNTYGTVLHLRQPAAVRGPVSHRYSGI